MTAPNPNFEPVSLTQGDTWAWELSLPSYPANGGWALNYSLRNATGFLNFAATADNSQYKILVPAASTVGSPNFPAGLYNFEAYVSNAGTGERYTIRRGTINVLTDLSAQSSTFDARSFSQKMVDAIRACLQGRATGGVDEYRIHNRELKYMQVDELMKWEAYYASKVRVENGKGQGRKLGVSFVSP